MIIFHHHEDGIDTLLRKVNGEHGVLKGCVYCTDQYGHQNINESNEHPIAKSVAPIHDKQCFSEDSVRASVPNGLEMARRLLHCRFRYAC
jgi:hypothetical protein